MFSVLLTVVLCYASALVFYTMCMLQPDDTPFSELEHFTPEREVSCNFDVVIHVLLFLYLGFRYLVTSASRRLRTILY